MMMAVGPVHDPAPSNATLQLVDVQLEVGLNEHNYSGDDVMHAQQVTPPKHVEHVWSHDDVEGIERVHQCSGR